MGRKGVGVRLGELISHMSAVLAVTAVEGGTNVTSSEEPPRSRAPTVCAAAACRPLSIPLPASHEKIKHFAPEVHHRACHRCQWGDCTESNLAKTQERAFIYSSSLIYCRAEILDSK